MFRRLTHQGSAVGGLYIEFSTEAAEARGLRGTLGVMGLCLLALVACGLLALRLQRFITVPVSQLVASMEKIGREGTLGTRVSHPVDDEIGALYRGFTGLLDLL